MDKIELHPDFKDFLKLLNSYDVRYLLVGGYSTSTVNFHWCGYKRREAEWQINLLKNKASTWLLFTAT